MAKQRLTKHDPVSTPSSQGKFQTQLEALLNQQKYRQALSEIHNAQRSQPDLVFQPSEAEIWLLRGKQEFQSKDLKQAEASLRRSLQLGLKGEAHYWAAKCLLSANRLDAAIALIRDAFEDGSLPKNYSICYPKLLLLQGDIATVEQLLSQQSKRFLAAQQHWLRGVLALKTQQPEVALTAFQKVKHPQTPGDRLDIWEIYTQQALKNWGAAEVGLGLKSSRWELFSSKPAYSEHPILERLALLQHLETGQPPLEQLQMSVNHSVLGETLGVLSILELIDENNPHDAAHVLLKLDRRSSKFPELASLRPALLALAGEQSLNQDEIGCAAEFWQRLHREQPFDPQLAVNLVKVLDLNEDYQELQRLLTRLIKWLEQDFQQHPQNWPEERRKLTLVYAHCRLADTWMAIGRGRAAMGELQIAERIDPRSPEVMGRHGLVAVGEKRYDEATQLLTQALEGGCRSAEVYIVLLETWKTLGNLQAAADIRRRFGKKFGDHLFAEADTKVLPWVEALSTRNYRFFSQLVKAGSDRDPAMRACQIFVEAIQGEPTSGGKVSLNQKQAVQAWEGLLQNLLPQEQVQPIEAIALSILLFTKREKGISALITQYAAKLLDLEQHPEARVAYLLILSLKERDPKKLQMPFRSYLSAQPQPGNALAQIQLQVRRYAQTVQVQILRPLIEESLKRELQNPLLLLAAATTYPTQSAQYEKLKQEGFEIARRLQDAKALQAFRDEEALLNDQTAQQFLPDPETFDSLDMGDMDSLLEGMIRKMFGGKIPPDELQRMLPELKQMMMNDMPDFEEAEESFGFGSPFGGFSPDNRKPSKRKRK